MFTGLVECTGRILSMTPVADGARYIIEIPFASELALGDSVAVNGCCLTVDQVENDRVAFDLLTQTMRVTSLGTLRESDSVNLERAMKGTDRVGGHFVMGHVDACGEIIAIEPVGQDHKITVRIPDEYTRYCIDKGSIAIDGISLTIAAISGNILEFWITPHTFARTNLSQAKPGTVIDIEVDMLAKYMEKLFAARTNGPA